jgi:regulator of cell morphogenesis and NO signaling
MEITTNTPVGEITSSNFLAAEVFRKYDIDFCCNGQRTLGEVCGDKQLNSVNLIQELDAVLKSTKMHTLNFQSWPPDFLADYIQMKHHTYVEETVPVLKNYLHKLCDVHGSNHPELFKIGEIFERAADELTTHMKKEELILFPYIKRISESIQKQTPLQAALFGSVENPIAMMKHEHNTEGDYFRSIAGLTNHYTLPADACNTYKVTFAMLKHFEEDLHLHIHLENNILFPKAIENERRAVR